MTATPSTLCPTQSLRAAGYTLAAVGGALLGIGAVPAWAAPADTELAHTGAAVIGIGILGLILVIIGIIAVAASKRRRRDDDSAETDSAAPSDTTDHPTDPAA